MALAFHYSTQKHSSGLTVSKRAKTSSLLQETGPDLDWNSMIDYDGSLVASIHPRSQPPYYPVLLPTDNSEPERSQPLYALAAEDAKFVEYYQTFCLGDSEVYAIASG